MVDVSYCNLHLVFLSSLLCHFGIAHHAFFSWKISQHLMSICYNFGTHGRLHSVCVRASERALAVESRITVSIFYPHLYKRFRRRKINRVLRKYFSAHIKKYGKAVTRNEREVSIVEISDQGVTGPCILLLLLLLYLIDFVYVRGLSRN